MNRLRKILTLGLEKKRAWQLPIIAALLVLFGLGVWWYYNWHYAGGFDVWELVEQGNTEYLAYVLRWRPGMVNAKDEDGWTLLHRAANGGRTEAIKILLEAGAKVNAKDKRGFTPLDWGISIIIDEEEFPRKVVRLLRKHGAKTGKELDAEAKQGKQE